MCAKGACGFAHHIIARDHPYGFRAGGLVGKLLDKLVCAHESRRKKKGKGEVPAGPFDFDLFSPAVKDDCGSHSLEIVDYPYGFSKLAPRCIAAMTQGPSQLGPFVDEVVAVDEQMLAIGHRATIPVSKQASGKPILRCVSIREIAK